MKAKLKPIYIAIRDFFKTADMFLLTVCLLLSAIGMVLIYSSTSHLLDLVFSDFNYFQIVVLVGFP